MSTPPASGSASRKFSARHPPAHQGIPLRVFIGYGDLVAARCASTTLADAVRSTGRRFNLEPMYWRFNQLASHQWRAPALRSALGADLVVLATSAPGLFSPAIEAWIGAYVRANRGRPTTLVAIAGPADAWTISIEEPEGGESSEHSDLVAASAPETVTPLAAGAD